MRKIDSRRIARLREMLGQAHGILRSLDGVSYDHRKLEPAYSEAQKSAIRLVEWLDEMLWIAERERVVE